MQLHLGGATADKTRQDLAAAFVPPRQLLLGDGVGVLAGVEAGDEGRRLGGPAAHVEGPRDEGAVLVGVEDDRGGGLQGNAVLEALGALVYVLSLKKKTNKKKRLKRKTNKKLLKNIKKKR